jgi:hypothetical protein
VQPLATRLLELAREQGINLEIVSAYRSPAEQDKLATSGAGVTKASALWSYHNHGLAFDIVPQEYKAQVDWNPSGPLWPRVGAIGESLGLEWGGRWGDPDRPHFQLRAAPIGELKAYWEKFQKIMPISIEPTIGAAGIILVIGLLYVFLLRPMLARRGYV